METGRLIQWLKQPGDAVKRGDVLAEVETDKAVMDVEAFHDGYLTGPLAETGSDIPVGQVIAYLSDVPQQVQQEQLGTTEKTRAAPKVSSVVPPTAQTVTEEKAPAPTASPEWREQTIAPALTGGQGIQASPYARGLAQELGVDLSQVDAAADGVIHAPQVLAAALAGPVPNLDAGPAYRYKLFTPMHRAVASNMIATLNTPTFRVSACLPLAPLKALAHEQKQSFTLLLARVCALCVQQHPHFNTVYTPHALAVRKQVDVGIAVDVPGGLLTPVLRNAAQRPLSELAEDWRILRERIKRNRLAPNDYQGATFYLSNLGVFDQVTHFDAVIPLGAAAILSLGAEQNGKAEFTLSCDHRVVFGTAAAHFLETLSAYLSNPVSMDAETTEKIEPPLEGKKS